MNDLISRQAAIDAFEDTTFTKNEIRRRLCGLSSAQPETHEERTETHACDLIDRQAAIDAIRASTSKYTGFMEMEMYTDDDAVEAIEDLPSAQPVITCDGCKFVGTYDTDFPCRNCIRREKDYYAQE